MKLMVATPVYRHEVMSPYVTSVVRDTLLATQAGHIVAPPVFLNDTLIHFARNRFVEIFLQTEADHLLFIDADLGWDHDAINKMLDTPGDIAGGVYRLKQDDEFYPFHGQRENLRHPHCPVDSVPTGFMRISREAMLTVAEKHPRPFQFEIDEQGTEWGEDLSFCNRARRLGLSIYARFDITFEHCGVKSWTGCASTGLELWRNK